VEQEVLDLLEVAEAERTTLQVLHLLEVLVVTEFIQAVLEEL
jgi:hypothetical protein